jgi:hypothetical protein
MTDSLLSDLLYALMYTAILGVPVAVYLRSLKHREAKARAAAEKGKLHSSGP